MEIRELIYFLAVAREQNISRAAEQLFITQPSLSRQMQNLENEIGKKLFVRGSKSITLTDAGVLLRRRAEEILELYEKTESELMALQEDVSGEIRIGGGESYAAKILAVAAKKLTEKFPQIKFHLYSGDTAEIMEKLDKGLIDFGLLVHPADLSKYESVQLNQKDTWGVYMRRDSPLAKKSYIQPTDLYGLPLIRSRHTLEKNEVNDWFKKDFESLNIVATYNLIHNAALLVEAGVGYAVCIDGLINCSQTNLCFKPFFPNLKTSLSFAWKRYQLFSKPCELYLDVLKSLLAEEAAIDL